MPRLKQSPPAPMIEVPLLARKVSFTATEAAEVIGVSKASFYRLVADGQILIRKIGSRTVVTRGELERFLGSSTSPLVQVVEAPPPPAPNLEPLIRQLVQEAVVQAMKDRPVTAQVTKPPKPPQALPKPSPAPRPAPWTLSTSGLPHACCEALTAMIAQHQQITEADAERLVRAVLGHLVALLGDHGTQPGWRMRVHGLGTFSTQAIAARKRINPRSGELFDAPAHTRLDFVFASGLRDLGKPPKPSKAPKAPKTVHPKAKAKPRKGNLG